MFPRRFMNNDDIFGGLNLGFMEQFWFLCFSKFNLQISFPPLIKTTLSKFDIYGFKAVYEFKFAFPPQGVEGFYLNLYYYNYLLWDNFQEMCKKRLSAAQLVQMFTGTVNFIYFVQSHCHALYNLCGCQNQDFDFGLKIGFPVSQYLCPLQVTPSLTRVVEIRGR